MPRPSRCRRVCAEPVFRAFNVDENEKEPITLFVDEFEVIRLVDFEKRTHEQCARQMLISRTTVTEIYEKARYKIADALVNGKPLLIAGGHYQVCRGEGAQNCPGHCRCRHRNQSLMNLSTEKGNIMKIAVPVKNENIYQHFGMAAAFKIYTIENQQIVSTEVVETNGRGHGAILDLLLNNQVNCVICGGIGEGAIANLKQVGIELVAGITAQSDEAVKAYLAGNLQSDLQAACDKSLHHGQGQGHGHGHCGGDQCGSHCDHQDHTHDHCHCQKH